MTTKSNSGKLAAFILVAIVGAAAGFGYFKQAAVMSESEAKGLDTPSQETAAMLSVKPNDIILGDANALVTVVEYSSLSCGHCANFHQNILPTLEKEFITPGKVKFVVRHFPLNAPALKGSQLVECAGQNGLSRANFMKVLFEMQPKWAFDEQFETNLKQISRVGGLDSAAFDSCMADKSLETTVIANRKEGEQVLKIDGTPAFFIDGVRYDGERTIDGMRSALKKALKSDIEAVKAARPAEKAPKPTAAPAAEAPEATEE